MPRLTTEAIHSALCFLPPKMAESYKAEMQFALECCNVTLTSDNVPPLRLYGETRYRKPPVICVDGGSIIFLDKDLQTASVSSNIGEYDLMSIESATELLKMACHSSAKNYMRNVLLLLATAKCVDGMTPDDFRKSGVKTLGTILAILTIHHKFGVMSKKLLDSLNLNDKEGKRMEWMEVETDCSLDVESDRLLEEFVNTEHMSSDEWPRCATVGTAWNEMIYEDSKCDEDVPPKKHRRKERASDKNNNLDDVTSQPHDSRSRHRSINMTCDLPVPRFTLDDQYAGTPPLREVVIFDFNGNEQFLANMSKKFEAEEVVVARRPINNGHLGMAFILFKKCSSAHAFIRLNNERTVIGTRIRCVFDPFGAQLADKYAEKTSGEVMPRMKYLEGMSEEFLQRRRDETLGKYDSPSSPSPMIESPSSPILDCVPMDVSDGNGSSCNPPTERNRDGERRHGKGNRTIHNKSMHRIEIRSVSRSRSPDSFDEEMKRREYIHREMSRGRRRVERRERMRDGKERRHGPERSSSSSDSDNDKSSRGMTKKQQRGFHDDRSGERKREVPSLCTPSTSLTSTTTSTPGKSRGFTDMPPFDPTKPLCNMGLVPPVGLVHPTVVTNSAITPPPPFPGGFIPPPQMFGFPKGMMLAPSTRTPLSTLAAVATTNTPVKDPMEIMLEAKLKTPDGKSLMQSVHNMPKFFTSLRERTPSSSCENTPISQASARRDEGEDIDRRKRRRAQPARETSITSRSSDSLLRTEPRVLLPVSPEERLRVLHSYQGMDEEDALFLRKKLEMIQGSGQKTIVMGGPDEREDTVAVERNSEEGHQLGMKEPKIEVKEERLKENDPFYQCDTIYGHFAPEKNVKEEVPND